MVAEAPTGRQARRARGGGGSGRGEGGLAASAGRARPGAPAGGRLAVVLGAAAIAAAGVGVYLNSFAGKFLLDDRGWILNDERLHGLEALRAAAAGPEGLGMRPVLGLSIAVNWELGGSDVWGYHAVNLAVHVLAGLLLFGVVRRTLAGARLRDRFGRWSTPLAAAVALLWVVHPLQTGSVTGGLCPPLMAR